jgi:hypothetical protein
MRFQPRGLQSNIGTSFGRGMVMGNLYFLNVVRTWFSGGSDGG